MYNLTPPESTPERTPAIQALDRSLVEEIKSLPNKHDALQNFLVEHMEVIEEYLTLSAEYESALNTIDSIETMLADLGYRAPATPYVTGRHKDLKDIFDRARWIISEKEREENNPPQDPEESGEADPEEAVIVIVPEEEGEEETPNDQ